MFVIPRCPWFLAGVLGLFFRCPTQPRSKEHLSLFELKAYHPHSLHAHDALDTSYPSSMRDACHMKTCYGPASLPFKNLWLSDWASLPSSQFTKFLISFRFCSCWSRHFQLPGLLSFWLCVWVSEEWAVHLIQLPRGKSSTSRMWIKQSR